jgi:hypothetical protein
MATIPATMAAAPVTLRPNPASSSAGVHRERDTAGRPGGGRPGWRATGAMSRHPIATIPATIRNAGDRYRARPLAEDQHAGQRRQQCSGAAPDRVDERKVTEPVAELQY